MKKIDKNYFFIAIFCLAALYIVIPENAIFGSTTDWASQHVIFPDYFRNLFYDTKRLFPNFAFSIGAGQNIYNFSYYGLLNPLILISYLLPFVNMTNYIIVLNIVLYIFFGIILYYFLKSKFKKDISFITTLIILCSGSVLFHFHRHFMFVDYLPFLVLALIGTDKYFESGKKSLLIFSTFMIIMISYYFSVFSIVVLCIYALYKYLEKTKKVELKKMIIEAFNYLIPIFIAILMSSVLLLPTIYVIKNGGGRDALTLGLDKFLPVYNIDAILYGNYSIGLTSISLLALINLLSSNKKEDKYLVIIILILLCIPIFNYALNGMLYFRNKVFIPFIPVFAFILAKFLDGVCNKKIPYINILFISIVLIVVSIFCDNKSLALFPDIILTLLMIYIYYKDLTNKKMFILILFIIPICVLFISNSSDKYVKNNYKSTFGKNYYKEIKDVLNKEKDIVRFNNIDHDLRNINEVYIKNYNHDSLYSSVSNSLYRDFYKDVFNNPLSFRNNLILSENNDILFQMFMGVKYVYSSNDAPVGYERISKHVYKNDNVLPLFYATSSLTNEKLFDELSYPYNINTLLNSAVVNDKSTKDITNVVKEIDLDAKVIKQENIKLNWKDNYLEVKSKNKGKIVLGLDKNLTDDILIVKLKLKETPSCKVGDGKITINGITNVLTCKEWMYKNNNNVFNYVISSNSNINKLNIIFDKNIYKISYLKVYELKYSDLLKVKENLSLFNIEKNDIDKKGIIGSIDMKDNGYFVSSIPYDKGFSAYIDNKKVKTEIVNKAFLGFKLKKGKHNIRIVYKSPLYKEGLILSIIGFILFIINIIVEKLHSYKRNI